MSEIWPPIVALAVAWLERVGVSVGKTAEISLASLQAPLTAELLASPE